MKRVIVFLIILNAIAFSLSASSRYALVIGNGHYEGVYLRNPVNDANAMANALRELDFYVIQKTDLTKKQMLDVIWDFENNFSSEDICLFYYSGHGVQVNGINYLIPLKANIMNERDVEFEAVALNRFMSNLEKAKMNIVILDACRDNPYKGTKSTSKGLAQVTSKTDGTFIAYATAPGNTAADGTGSNSPYTKHLIREMKVDGQEIEDVFKNVRIAVKDETNNAQIPWDSSCLTDEFIFAMSCTPQTQPEIEVETEYSYGTIKVESNADGSVYADNDYVCTITAGTIKTLKNIRTGSHTVKVKTDDETKTEYVNVQKNRTSSLDFYFIQDNTEDNKSWLHIEVNNLDSDFAKQHNLNIDKGVIVSKIDIDSPAYDSNLNVGDVILELEDEDIENTKDYLKAVEKIRNEDLESVLLYVMTPPHFYHYIAIMVQ
ncbi:MAG: caspase family protein [Candidatus Celaenobacter antarcticus]|nr:caspase family protein [Candidatus Celaenobacter antarcticus]